MPLPLTPFYMIRHGQTEANLAQLWAGSLDSPLTVLGRQQAQAARKTVESLSTKPTVIYHSNLSRARDTAQIINENLALPMIEDPDLAEMHVGEWEGTPHPIGECHNDPWLDPPGGETVQEFLARVKRAKNKALTQEGHLPLIVCHGWVFRAFGALYDISARGIQNCHLHHFTPQEGHKTFPWLAKTYHYDEQMVEEISPSFHPAPEE